MMHDISHEHVLKMCVHTPQAQSHSLASIEPIQEPRKKNKELQQINIIKIRRKRQDFLGGWAGKLPLWLLYQRQEALEAQGVQVPPMNYMLRLHVHVV